MAEPTKEDKFWNGLCWVKDAGLREFGKDPEVLMACGLITALIAAKQRKDLQFAAEGFGKVVEQLKQRHPKNNQN